MIKSNEIFRLVKKHKETTHNFFWRSLQIGAKQGTTFLIFFIAAYYLIPEDLGLFSYLMAVVGLLLIVCDFGFSPSASKYVAELKAKKSKNINRILFSISVVIIGLATVVSLFVIFFGKYIFEEYILLLYLIPYLFFLPLSSVADGVYRGLKNFKKLSVISVVVAVFSLPVSFFLIKSYGLIGAIISQNILFGLLTAALFVFKGDIEFKFDGKVTKDIVKYAMIIGLANIAFFLYTRVDILILKQFGFIVEIGYYEIVNKVFTILFIPAAILGQVIAPDITKYMTLGKVDIIRKKIIKFLPIFILEGALFSLILYFLFPLGIKWFFPKYYTESFMLIMSILLILLPIKLWGIFLTNGFITPGGFIKIVTITTFIGGFLNVIFDYIFISWFGFIGVFWVTLVIHSTNIMVQGIYFFKRLK